MANQSPFPLMPPRSTEARLEHFDEEVYAADSSTLIFKLIDALCSDAGAGTLKKEIFIQRLSGALEGIYYSDLDYVFGNMRFLSRAPSESYTYSPSTEMLTSAQWDEVRVKDAWYRSRIRDFFTACSLGGTERGVRMAVQAAISSDCTLYENWRYIDCADEETEILTKSGYKHYSQIEEGEEVLTLNMSSGLAEWQAPTKINVFPVVNHEMLSVEMGTRHSSLTTMNHRWPVSSRMKCPDGVRKYSSLRIRTSDELKTEDRFIRAAPVIGLPDVAKHADALVELVAWFITEGHVHAQTSVVTIVQSHAVNPDKVDQIQAALTALIGPPVERFKRTGPRADQQPAWRKWVSESKPDITVFRLNSAGGRLLIAQAPDKVASMDFIHSLTKSQLRLFLDTCISADGHVRKDGYRSFVQKSMARMAPIQVAATLLGIPTSVQTGPDRCHVLSLCERQKFVQPLGQGRKNAKKVRYTGTVWCPTTPNGTWFARRRGATYFTGNSFGLGDNLGRSGSRQELVVQPKKETLSPQETRLLRQMLDAIRPMDAIFTISLQGLAVANPVPISAVTADSTYYEVQKIVTATPDIAKLPAPELLAIDLDPSEKWLFSGSPELAPYAAFNITQEYSYYYLASGGPRSPIDQVSYGTLGVDGTVTPEQTFAVYTTSTDYTPWTEYPSADSPDNFPGGKFGLTPKSAPALNPNGTEYQFAYTSQQEYVEARKAEVLAAGGQADDLRYRLPVQSTLQSKTSFTPDLAIAWSAPTRQSTVTSSWTARRPRTANRNRSSVINFVRS